MLTAHLNPFPHNNLLTPLGNKPFENTVGKGEIARNEQFFLYPHCFLPIENFLIFSSNSKLPSADFQFGPVQNLSSGNGLNLSHKTSFRSFQVERVCRQQFKIG